MFKVANLKDKLPPSPDQGKTLKRPKVFVGSASEGLLMPGDKVVGINHQDATKLTHLEAQNLIKHAGTSAKIDVVRPSYGGTGGYNSYSYDAPLEPQTKEFEAEKVLSQVSSQPISPISPNSGNQQVKTINIGGTQKQIVSSQFNSPLNMYSEEAIAESALTNQALVQSK